MTALAEKIPFLLKFQANTIVPACGKAIAVPYIGVCITAR